MTFTKEELLGATAALQEAENGSIIASIAITASLGEALDWPQHMRVVACETYGLQPDTSGPLVIAAKKMLDKQASA